MNKKVGLIILDGWGHGDKSKSDGIFNANTPYVDYLEKHSPNAELLTHGEHVGLPAGQMGNSEVGHLNIGAGRIVYQELTRINKSILDNEFQQNKTIIEAFNYAKSNKKKVHFIGLVSDGGVHSSMDHLVTLCEMTKTHELNDVFIHAFTDGRDCNPTTGIGHIKTLEEKIAHTPAKIASLVGRYYAMDRDNRWERIKQAYDLMIHGIGEEFDSAEAAISSAYSKGITDEFILPSKIGKMDSNISSDDVVICFNFRTDRCREITIALTQHAFPEFNLKPIPLYYVTMTNYDKSFKHIKVVFEKANLINTLGEIVAKNGLSQLRIAETEKYPHVSFFFSGGQEQPFPNEDRILIPSPAVATYDLQPEMSAIEIKDAICKSMAESGPDFFCLNFANTDMVGHTGDYNAILKAAEVVDTCLKEIIEVGQHHNYSFVIIADHGNSDFAINKDGSPNTAHSTNPVPILVLDPEVKTVNNGTLRDVAPTILALLNIKKPAEMTGNVLINS